MKGLIKYQNSMDISIKISSELFKDDFNNSIHYEMSLDLNFR